MKRILAALLLSVLPLCALAAPPKGAPSMDEVEKATQAQGFVEVSARKAKDPYYSSKRTDAKTWMSIDAYPAGSSAKQVAIICNQCRARKMSEELAINCYQEVQTLATALKVDLPGEVIRAFEGTANEHTWEIKDQAAKKVRFQKTGLKCDRGPGGQGIRFDIFYTK